MLTTYQQILFCAKECERQQSGELSVYNMIRAFDYAISQKHKNPTKEFIVGLGKLIEPQKITGFRKIPVTINSVAIPYQNIERSLDNLLEAFNIDDASLQISPKEFYVEFEKIHPFVDGNGRVGVILYNIYGEDILNPVIPPNAF